jgi:hypothetical protein
VGATRRELLTRAAALASAAGLGAGLEPGLAGSEAAAASGRPATRSEGAVLRGLVEVEQLLVFSYRAALESAALTVPARLLVAQILGYERAHLRALSARLSELALAPPPAPRDAKAAQAALARRHSHIDFSRRRDERGWLGLLLDVEFVAQRNYHVALGRLRTPALLELCARIYASEGQHSVLLGLRLHPGKPRLALDPFVNGD